MNQQPTEAHALAALALPILIEIKFPRRDSRNMCEQMKPEGSDEDLAVAIARRLLDAAEGAEPAPDTRWVILYAGGDCGPTWEHFSGTQDAASCRGTGAMEIFHYASFQIVRGEVFASGRAL